MIKPAIVVVGYNRPDSIIRLLESINRATFPFEDIPLIVSIDECKLSNDVEEAAKSVPWIHGSKIIRRFQQRQGLKNHILLCGDLSYEYGAVIILEDDLMVSPSFYQFSYEACNFYNNDCAIAGVSLYSHMWNAYSGTRFIPSCDGCDVFLGQFSITWGECWTKKQWKSFRLWIEENEQKSLSRADVPPSINNWGEQSWGRLFVYYIVEKDIFYVVPHISMTTNFSDLGEHCSKTDTSHQVRLLRDYKKDYSFKKSELLVKYDLFFERVLDDYNVSGISGKEICVNLNCTKNSTFSRRYLLSPLKLKYDVVDSFGLSVRPIDENITLNIKGNDIFLYDCKNQNNKIPQKNTRKRIDYDLFGYRWNDLLFVGVARFLKAIKERIGKKHR